MSSISDQDSVFRATSTTSSKRTSLKPIVYEDTSLIELSSKNPTKKNILSLGLIPLVKIFVDKVALSNILPAVNNSKKEKGRRLAYKKAYFYGTEEQFFERGK